MRVLVVRARDDATRTAARLCEAGHEALLSPVIEIVATGASLPDTPVDAILATSVHALTGIAQLPSALAGAPWLVVGERLHDMLAQRGFGEAEVVTSDAASLLEAIVARYPEPFRFLYLAGRDRKDILERTLQAHGHDVSVVETYEAQEIVSLDEDARQSLQRGEIDAVLHFSRRSAELFATRVNDAGLTETTRRLRHIAISSDTAAPLLAQGWRVEIADRPDEDNMLALLA